MIVQWVVQKAKVMAVGMQKRRGGGRMGKERVGARILSYAREDGTPALINWQTLTIFC